MQADVSLPSKIFISTILQLKRVPSLIFQHTRGFYCFVRYLSLHLSITIIPASFLESSQLHNNLTVGFPSISNPRSFDVVRSWIRFYINISRNCFFALWLKHSTRHPYKPRVMFIFSYQEIWGFIRLINVVAGKFFFFQIKRNSRHVWWESFQKMPRLRYLVD